MASSFAGRGNFKATQSASLAAVVEAANAHRDVCAGLADLIGGDSSSIVLGNNMTFPNHRPPPPGAGAGGRGGGGSSPSDVSGGGVGTVGDGNNNAPEDASDTGAVVVVGGGGGGHRPSPLPSAEAVSAAASRQIGDAPPFVTMSARDSAPQLKLEDPTIVDGGSSSRCASLRRRLVVGGGARGYRTSRATHGVSAGCYYYEALILGSSDDGGGIGLAAGRGAKRQLQGVDDGMGGRDEAADPPSAEENAVRRRKSSIGIDGHLRIGWCTRLADLQAPVGYGENSYAIRDILGSRVHKSRREDKWGGEGFGPGDVVGMAICLVDGQAETTHGKAAASADSTGGIDADGTKDARREGSESVDEGNPSSTLANHIRFFKNGQSMGNSGIGFNNINLGTFYPAISCYGESRAYLNFGPNFVHPPKGLPSEIFLRPISELCVPPPLPEEAVERVIPAGGSKEGKNAFFSKRTDDNILLAFKELVRVEAIVRHQAYLKHMDLHMLEISAIRKEHGLPTLDDQQHSYTT